MGKKKICFIAQFPPPVHGLSKAVETLYNSNMNQEFAFEKIDITNNKLFFKNFMKIKKSNADLFYFTISQTKGGNLRDLMILKLLRKQKKKCLIHLHGGYYRTLVDNDMPKWQKRVNYKAVSDIDGAIVLGDSLKWIFEGMLPDERIFIVPNCADDGYVMSDEAFEKKLTAQNQQKVRHILYLSNFIRSKGYPEVLELAKLEKERCAGGGERMLHFDFAGGFFEEAEKKFFFDYIKNNRLENYVTYHGAVGGDKKRALLNKCDVFALLTRYPKEGQPISILEAMGNGMIIVTTDHAGIPDIVRDSINGIVVKKDFNIKELYSSICGISRDELKSIASNNRRTVTDFYNQRTYICRILECFRKIIYKKEN